jgi:5-methylcytosine-specific restriction endonuclease McrA
MLDAYEQMLYQHFFRHSHLEGKQTCVVGVKSLRTRIGLGTGNPGKPPSEDQIRTKLRSLERKQAIEILGRSRAGTEIRVFLPSEIEGCLPSHSVQPSLDLEVIDFTSPQYRAWIIERERYTCFYCRRALDSDQCELDHVVPAAGGGNETYRNIVATCLDCNNSKSDQSAENFVRTLFRRQLLSEAEVHDRLKALEDLQAGRLVPDIPGAQGVGNDS